MDVYFVALVNSVRRIIPNCINDSRIVTLLDQYQMEQVWKLTHMQGSSYI